MNRIEGVNDFVIKFANVNGSGSASANELFAKAILRMGVPVSPRNIFPSNIQGLPTWYEARVSERGYQGRRGGIDMMVAMNPQTWDADVAEIAPGGYLFYDSTRPMPESKFRPDIQVLGMPLTEICNAVYSEPRQRQLFKNIVYVGALSVLLEIEPDVIEQLFSEQYKGKEKLLAANVQALHLGRDFAREHLPAPLGIRVQRRDKVGARIFVDGNSAVALGCVYGGATVAAWYPITPSSSVAEAFLHYCSRFRVDPDTGLNNYAVVQAEDEIASIGMVVGAGWNGARAFTATSGPGVSLMTEFIGLAYFRRDSGHHHQCAARRPVHRHAHAHPAGRSGRLRLRLAWRHQACAVVSARPARVFHPWCGRARPGGPAADAGVRDDRSGHRHEPAPVRAAGVGSRHGTTTAARS